MKAAFIKKTGTPDVIEWGDLPIPDIKDDEVLVKVSAVTVNPIDTYIRSGKYKQNPPLPQPYIIGRDLVGTVSRVGANVKDFKPGERVWTISLGAGGKQGSFAEYAVVSRDFLYHAPKDVADVDLAAVLLTGATASLGLIRDAMLKSTDTIFINGGGGSVASALIQLSKGRGSRVIVSTSGKEKAEWCKSIGADIIYDYKKDNIQELIKQDAPDGVNVFWDTSRTPNFDFAVSLLANKGRLILIAGAGVEPPFPVGPFYHKECTMKGCNTLRANKVELRQCADVINLCLEKNQLKSKIAKVLPLSDTATAHALMESSEVWGKIVLTV